MTFVGYCRFFGLEQRPEILPGLNWTERLQYLWTVRELRRVSYPMKVYKNVWPKTERNCRISKRSPSTYSTVRRRRSKCPRHVWHNISTLRFNYQMTMIANGEEYNSCSAYWIPIAPRCVWRIFPSCQVEIMSRCQRLRITDYHTNPILLGLRRSSRVENKSIWTGLLFEEWQMFDYVQIYNIHKAVR